MGLEWKIVTVWEPEIAPHLESLILQIENHEGAAVELRHVIRFLHDVIGVLFDLQIFVKVYIDAGCDNLILVISCQSEEGVVVVGTDTRVVSVE